MLKIFFKICTLTILIIQNTIFAQNVASSKKIILKWKSSNSDKNSMPICENFDLSNILFNDKKIPSILLSFETATKEVVTVSDFLYTEINVFNSYFNELKSNLNSEFTYKVNHSMGGNQGYTNLSIAVYKLNNNKLYQLTGFTYNSTSGQAFTSLTASRKRAVTTSVLSTGNWFKFSTSQNGIYKIDAQMLKSIGINLSSIDPRTIKIYSQQGAVLPELNSGFRYDDLPENSIVVNGETDGIFNDNDFILFYGESPVKWNYNSSQNRDEHQNNIYSDKTYFFLTYGGINGKRMLSKTDGNNLTADKIFTSFNHKELHELELENYCNEGKVVYGEKFDQKTSYTFNYNFDNLDINTPLTLVYSMYAVSPAASAFIVNINNLGNKVSPVSALVGDYLPCNQETGIQTLIQSVSSNNFNINFTYNKSTSSSFGHLDFFEIHGVRQLKYSEGLMYFKNYESKDYNTSEYQINNVPNGIILYDVSNPYDVKIQPYFTDNNNAVFRDQNNKTIKTYLLSDGNTLSPNFESTVANQNLHGVNLADFIIVSHPNFLDAANKLAEFHRTHDNMNVYVTTPQLIYNEFSCGSQDISAIRDFLRHVYLANTNPANQLKYALLMGDASFDYKDIISNNTNFVPVYESNDTNFEPFCSDDFYGYFDPNEGNINQNDKLEISVNRLPVATAEEANAVVNKIIHYKKPETYGEWRNSLCFIGDDFDKSWEPKYFIDDFEEFSKKIDTTYRHLLFQKIYSDAYRQLNLGGSQRYPDVYNDISKEFNKGGLIFNYIGHGGPAYLADEKIFDIPLINSINNMNNIPAFFTATCSFTGFDNARFRSAGEYLILNPNGGAIANFTTTRIVDAQNNANITKEFWENCAFVKIGGKYPKLGDIYKKLKNRVNPSSNDRMFTLLADPALTLNYPNQVVVIDSIINNSQNKATDTLNALSKMTFVGHIEDQNGNPINDFNGLLYPTILDKESSFSTLANDALGLKRNFKAYTNILYKGSSTVNSGKFRFTCVIPKDIAYNYGIGKISLYAHTNSDDATGYKKITVGGTEKNIANDTKGPDIELFIDDYSFVSGGLTDNTPIFLAKIYDENGINTSGSGIGRDMLVIIDKGTNKEKTFVVNKYYKALLNSYTNGELNYQGDYIEAGKHTYTLKVWDSYNNSMEETIEFVIGNSDEFRIEHVYNYPNPFSTNTKFLFNHNNAGDNLQVTITITTISGKVIKTIERNIDAATSLVSDIEWNGRDDYEDKLSKGVYIYKITVKNSKGEKAEKTEKLVILN